MKNSYIINKGILNSNIVGGKGYSLLKLKENGVNVPDFFIISTYAFDSFIKLKNRAEAGSGKIKKSKNIELPKEIEKEIIKSYSKFIKEGMVAVRSSATIEDSSKNSYAGKFKTELFVAKGDLLRSIREVYKSIYKVENLQDMKEVPKMAVIIQRQIDSEKSGVLFVTKDNIVINAILGQGERFVSGKEVGDIYKIYLNKRESDPDVTINFQKYANIRGENKKLPILVSYSQKLLNSEIRKLADEAIKIYKIFDSPQDVEWCIKGNNIFILQSRPITSNLPSLQSDNLTGDIPVSEGIGKGMPWEDVKNIPKEPVIIVKDEVGLGDIKYLSNSNIAGIISKYDGMLSHVSILARELKIPYITGVNDFEKILNSKEVLINGSTGEIKIKGKSGKLISIINKSPSTFKWIHKDIKNIIYINKMKCLVRKLGKFSILYSEESKGFDQFQERLPNCIKLSGPSDVYVSYGLLFRSIEAEVDNSIKLLKEAFVKALDAKSVNRFKVAYEEAKARMIAYYTNAKNSYNNYSKSKDKKALIEAYVDSTKAYIYFNMVRNSAFDYAEYIFGREMSNGQSIITDAELYKKFSDTKRGELLEIRKLLIHILDDISNAADEDTSYSMMDFEETVALELKKAIGDKEYKKIMKINFG